MRIPSPQPHPHTGIATEPACLKRRHADHAAAPGAPGLQVSAGAVLPAVAGAGVGRGAMHRGARLRWRRAGGGRWPARRTGDALPRQRRVPGASVRLDRPRRGSAPAHSARMYCRRSGGSVALVPMARPAPAEPAVRYTVERYSRLVEEGVLSPDERVELLEGVIVGMAPHSPRHAAGITR